MSNSVIHTKCLGHCRAQDRAWKASPELYAQQKASIAAYEAGKPSVFHGHCWAKAHPEVPAAQTILAKYEDEKDENACLGHVRAQEIAVRSDAAKAAYELEKASIKSYEDGWDNWDGPVWPWKGAHLSAEAEEKYDNNYTPPELDERTPVSVPEGLSKPKSEL